jgi:hypothetical protein
LCPLHWMKGFLPRSLSFLLAYVEDGAYVRLQAGEAAAETPSGEMSLAIKGQYPLLYGQKNPRMGHSCHD